MAAGAPEIPYCIDDREDTKETEGGRAQFAGQRPCQMGKRRRCFWASIGTTEPPQARGPLRGEERILQCLGAAVLLQWNDLPTPIQRQLFEHAVSMGEAGQTAKLKEQPLAFFINIKMTRGNRGDEPPALSAKLQQASSGGPGAAPETSACARGPVPPLPMKSGQHGER